MSFIHNYIRGLSIAGMVGSLGTIMFSFVYAFTHGSNTFNKMESLLGLNELEWGRIAAIIPVLLWAALLAFRYCIENRITRLTIIGYWLASAAMAVRVISEIPQFFINMRIDYQSPLGTSSWLLYLLSLPLLTVGMLMIGMGCRRSGARKTVYYAPLFVGLLIVPTLVAGGILSGISDDSTIFRIGTALLSIPLGLAWLWFSSAPLLKDQL